MMMVMVLMMVMVVMMMMMMMMIIIIIIIIIIMMCLGLCNGGDASQLQTQMWAKSSGVARLQSPSQPEVVDRGPKRMPLGGANASKTERILGGQVDDRGNKREMVWRPKLRGSRRRIVLGGQSR